MQQNTQLNFDNIGCLKHLSLTLKPGVNIIKAPNASGKTSLIRGLAAMFTSQIPPAHILALDQVYGKTAVQYAGKAYEKHYRRTPTGQVGTHGAMLPFADPRAYDACVAMAETGIVHKITGGTTQLREYLESLSYGNHYSTIISMAQELTNEMSRELAGPSFAKFESLPYLLTELTNFHVRRDQQKDRIESLKAEHETAVQALAAAIEQKISALSREEMKLSELGSGLEREKEKEQQLSGFLKLTDDSAKVAAQIKEGVAESRRMRRMIADDLAKQEKLVEELKKEFEGLRDREKQEKDKEVEGLESLQHGLQQLDKAIILKEEEIQQAERFPDDDPKYPARLVVEVRAEIMRKIEWLDKVVDYFQDKYMRRMTSARLKFNGSVTRAFEALGLKGFENVFLDQDFSLQIVRNNGVRQPVETLSASEKLTVSLMLMVAAKETFLPDFPFFIVDELTLSYDPARFRRIVEYIGRNVPYVIVTSLTSEGTGRPEVGYEL
jgi:energy-coupling factor transporter ATP-binding protein EcfA2